MLSKCDKIHLKFCKYILDVSSRATNLAVRGEIGRYPLLLQILANIFKYLMHITEVFKNDLLTEAFQLSENLSNSGIDSWVNSIKSILTYLKINVDIKGDCKKLYLKVLKSLAPKDSSIWREKISVSMNKDQQKGNKLMTYSLFKQNFTMEKIFTVWE